MWLLAVRLAIAPAGEADAHTCSTRPPICAQGLSRRCRAHWRVRLARERDTRHDCSKGKIIDIDSTQVAADAQTHVQAFERLASGIPYERKGVLYSEMLFVYAILRRLQPKRILESGRARGQSTHLLAACFPATPIVSIEFDAQSPDVAVAAARLRPFANVELLFGDATVMLPQLLRPGDAVMIDGPKGFRALRLALQLLSLGDRAPVATFIHDSGHGSVERAFLAQAIPHTLYSDEARFVRQFAFLDKSCNELDPGLLHPDAPLGTSYGPTFACVLPDSAMNYASLRLRLAARGFAHRMQRALAKRSQS